MDDKWWAVIEPILPPWPERSPGPKPVSDRLCLQGILFVLYTGIPWQQLPLELSFGSGQTCWQRLAFWLDAGVFDQLHRIRLRGLGKLRYVVEQTFALLHQFKRLAVRRERRLDHHDGLVSLACSLICWRRLRKTIT